MEYLRNILLIIGAAFGAAFVIGCNSEPFKVDDGNQSGINNRKLDITVYHVYQTNPVQDSLLPDAEVVLYKNLEDRWLDLNRQREGFTDSTGHLVLPYINDEFYYVGVYDETLGSDTTHQISTPLSAEISYLEIFWVTD